MVNNDVYIGSSSGNLYAVDVSSGQSAWSTNVGTAIQAPDEQSANMQSGLGAGEGHLVVPAGSTVTAFGTVSVQLCDAAGHNVSNSSITLTATGIYNSAGTLVQPLNNTFAFITSLDRAGRGYSDKVNAGGLAAGTYSITFRATGDGIAHLATFAVR